MFSQACTNKFLRKEWNEKDSIVNVKDTEINQTYPIRIFPNPFTDLINLEIKLDKNCKMIANIYDLTGKLLKKVEFEFNTNSNEFYKIDLKDLLLQNGTYIIKINYLDKEYSEKVVRGQ